MTDLRVQQLKLELNPRFTKHDAATLLIIAVAVFAAAWFLAHFISAAGQL